MADTEIIKALDILDKFNFFGGQRAGRELWNDKPLEVQDIDIENFAEDVQFLKDLIQRQQERIERLKDNLDAVLAERADLTEAIEKFADKIVGQLEAEKYRGLEGLEPIKVAFNFGINKALDIVQGVNNDDR